MKITINKQMKIIKFEILNKKGIKEIEETLYDYKNIDLKVECLDIHINSVLNDRLVFDGILSIEDLRIKKNKIIDKKDLINNALNKLSDEEYKIIELRYFQRNRKTWFEIGNKLGFEKDYLCKKNKKILNKIGQFLNSF